MNSADSRKMDFEMSAYTDGFNDRYFAVALSEDIYMVSGHIQCKKVNFWIFQYSLYKLYVTDLISPSPITRQSIFGTVFCMLHASHVFGLTQSS